ncbi:MAG: hypothetical protein V7L25_15245 [Nostoc sp.]
MSQPQLHQVNPQVQQCIQILLDCRSTCLNTITSCLEGNQLL